MNIEDLIDGAEGAMPRMTDEAEAKLRKVAPRLIEEGVSTPMRAAGFFGNLGHESSDLTRLEENLNYSAKRLMQVWPTRFRTADQAARYARNPEALANNVYSGRMGNGNEASGDGWRFRGRGPLQLTGRHNYTKCAEATGLDIVENPDKVIDLEYGFITATWFFNANGLWPICDAGDWNTLTRRINGGTHGHDDRVNRINAALSNMDGVDYVMPPRTLRVGSRGPDVADVQEVVGAVPNDGIFGRGTEAAVKAWQEANGLVADGIVGPATQAKMGLA